MKYLPILLILMFCLPANAEPLRLSLKEAVSQALVNDHLVKAATREREAGIQNSAATRSGYLPRLFLEEGAVVTNSPTRAFMLQLDQGRFSLAGDLNHPRTGNDFRTALSLEQSLLDFSIGRQLEADAAGEQYRDSALARKREEVAFRTFSLYLGVQRARGHQRAVEQAVAAASEHRRVAARRTEAGTGLKGDELRLRTYLTERELDKLQAENELRLAHLRLASAIGKRGIPVDIAEELPTTIGTGTVDELLQIALRRRAELREGEATVARSDSMVKVAESAYLPTVTATATYQQNDRDLPFGRDNDAWMVGATLRWELFDGMRRRHTTARARAERSAAAEYLEEARAAVLLEVEENVLRLREAEKRMEVVQQAVADAEETVRLVGKRYENALATVSELLDAQSALNRRRTEATDAGIDATLATARVNHSAGIFLQEIMK